MTSAERPNELRYLILLALNNAPGPIDYRDELPGVDYFELRSAASWLVENTYAVWSGGGVAITDHGRQLLATVRSVDGRTPEGVAAHPPPTVG
jgi:hypothetical protein